MNDKEELIHYRSVESPGWACDSNDEVVLVSHKASLVTCLDCLMEITRITHKEVMWWVLNYASDVAETIPLEICPSHEGGAETCWGQEGHIWSSGPQGIMTLCWPDLVRKKGFS